MNDEIKIKMDHLRIHKEEIPEQDPNKKLILKFIGHFDEGNEKEVDVVYKIIEDGSHPMCLILDLEDLKYVNSAGIGRIADWYSKISSQQGNLFLTNLKPEIKEIFDLVGISNLIPSFDSNKKALESLEV